MQIIYQCSACGDQFTSESYLHLHVNRGNHHALNIQLLELLAKNGPRTSSQLGKEIGVPRVTIIDALANLIARGKVKKYPAYQAEQGRGRPPILFSIAGASDPEPRWQWDWACDEVVARLKALPNGVAPRYDLARNLGMVIASITFEHIIKKLIRQGRVEHDFTWKNDWGRPRAGIRVKA